MITIKNLDPITEAPETYGYISLGTLGVNRYTRDLVDMLRPSIYKGECDSSGKVFDLYLFKIGATRNYAILGDLTCIPGNTLIDNQELLEALEKKLEAKEWYLEKEHNIYNRLNLPTINGASTSIYSPGNTTILDPTFKVNYDSQP